jgi:hypothetical protein
MVTAELHASFWADGEAKVAPELRLREARMGATYEDRLRLRLRVTDAAPQPTTGERPSAVDPDRWSHLRVVDSTS